LEGNGGGLIWGTIPEFAYSDWKTPQSFTSYPVSYRFSDRELSQCQSAILPSLLTVLAVVVLKCTADIRVKKHTTHRNTSQHIVTHRKTLQHIAKHYNTSQHIAKHYNTSQHIATRHNSSQHLATLTNVTF